MRVTQGGASTFPLAIGAGTRFAEAFQISLRWFAQKKPMQTAASSSHRLRAAGSARCAG